MEQALVLFLLLMLVGCGGFSIYTAIKLKRKGYLFNSRLLYPGNCNPAECSDEVGFMTFIIPRLTILGVVCLISAAIIAVDTYIGLGLPAWVSGYIVPFIGLPVFIWFMYVQNKASKLFW